MPGQQKTNNHLTGQGLESQEPQEKNGNVVRLQITKNLLHQPFFKNLLHQPCIKNGEYFEGQ